jgi:hypothetical protein
MTVSTSTRMGVTLWTIGSDPFTRSQMQASHAAIEAQTAGYLQGVSSRPAAALALKGFYYFEETGDVLSYCDGADWFDLNAFGSVVSLTPDLEETSGAATTFARSDHAHDLPNWGSVTTLNGSSSNGSAETFARSDHKHDFGTQSVPGAALVNASVTNAQIHATAAIALSKLGTGTAGISISGNAATATSATSATTAVTTSGNAATSSRWFTARTVTFATGDVTGSFSIRGDAAVNNVALAVTNDSHSHTGSTISNLSSADITTWVNDDIPANALAAVNSADISAGTIGAGSDNFTFPNDVSMTSSGELHIDAGTETDPGLNFLGDTNTGFTGGGIADTFHAVTGGSRAATFLSSGSFGVFSLVSGAYTDVGSEIVSIDGELTLILRSDTSVERDKLEIEPWSLTDDQFRELRPSTWIQKGQYVEENGGIRGLVDSDYEEDGPPEGSHLFRRAGFTWENCAEVDLHLVFDEGLAKPALIAATIDKVQDCMDRLDALEKAV